MAGKTPDTYIEAVGRRKPAPARVRVTPADRTAVIINDRQPEQYFGTEALRMTALEPFLKVSLPSAFAVSVHVWGGGIRGQAEAVRHGISRALIAYDKGLRPSIKKEGFLK